MRRQFFILASIAAWWLWPLSGQAASTVVISEVAAFEPEGREWVEIVNRGTDPIDLAGWKFIEDSTNHGLKFASGASTILEPGHFAIIADDASQFSAAYPEVTVIILDSSWGTLKESGELIGLRDAAGEIIDQFSYPASSGGTAERIDLASSGDIATNWQLSPTKHSAGQPNSAASVPVSEPVVETAPPAAVPPAVVTDTPAPAAAETETPPAPALSSDVPPTDPTLPAALPCGTGQLRLSELVADPSDGEEEYVELQYRGERSAALTGWSIADGAGRTTLLDSLFVLPASVVVIEKPKGVLNNGGDQVVLQCGGQTADAVSYGRWDDGNMADNAPAAPDPWSLMLDAQGDWLVTTTPTKGQVNQFTAPPAPAMAVRAPAPTPSLDTPAAADEPVTTPPVTLVGDATGCVRLSELLPNPEGNDANGEFIELVNCDQRPLNLVGWSIGVGSRQYQFLDGPVTIESGNWLTIPRTTSQLTLRNSGGDTVTITQPDGTVTDQVEYATAPAGQSYAQGATGWQWSAHATPGAANVIAVPNEPPTAEFQLLHPRRTEIAETIMVDASDSSDTEAGPDSLQYAWDWGDGTGGAGVVAEHGYATAGRYRITLTVTDAAGAADRVSRQLTIYAPAAQTDLPPSAASAKPAAVVAQITPGTLAEQPLNRRVQFTGTVIAPPGLFGRQTMLVEGAEVYFGAADWPEVAVGDVVRLTGTVGQRAGQPRLRLANRAAVVVQQHGLITPTAVTVLTADQRQRLVQVTGTVSEVRQAEFLLGGSFGQLPVVIKKSTGIGSPVVTAGQTVTVVGVLVSTHGDWQLWPRTVADIGVTVPSVQAEIIVVTTTAAPWWQPAAVGFGAAGALWQVVQSTLT